MTSPLREQPAVAAVLARFPGAEIVDVRSPATDPAAPMLGRTAGNYSLGALAQLCADEASRIDAAQAALVEAGDRAAPDPVQITKRDGFDALARLLTRIKANPVIMDHLRSGRA